MMTLSVSFSVFGSQNTPNRSTLAMRSPAAATPTPVYSLFIPIRPLHDRTNKVVSPLLPASSQAGQQGYDLPSQAVQQGYDLPSQAGQQGYDLPSQAGGFLPSQVPSQPGQHPDPVQPRTHDNPVMVSRMKQLPPRPDDIPLKVAAPELLVSANPAEVICIGTPSVGVQLAATLRTKSCVTEGRTNSPELFDSDDLSSQLPSTHRVMTKIDSVLREIAGEERGNVTAAPGSAIIVKTDHAYPQTSNVSLEQTAMSKTRNGSSGLDSEERSREPVDMSLDTTSDTKGSSVQCRKPLFRNVRKSLPCNGADDPANAVGEPGPTMSRSDAVDRKDVKVQSNVRMTSKLSVEQSDKEIQPCRNEPDHMAMELKCEPPEGTAGPACEEPSLKRNVRNKRRRSFGAGCRKKGRGVEFIDLVTEGSTEVCTAITHYLFISDNLQDFIKSVEYSYTFISLLALIPLLFSLISMIVFVIKS